METEHVFNGRYRVDTKLGTGGTAIVYCGTDLLLRRRVAIKVLRDQYSSDDDFIQRFSNEAQAAAKLSHPNVVNVFDFGREGDAYFIVMELVDGETLAAMLQNDHQIPEPIAIDYATQIAAGLAFAHRQGLLHRDIKPANILVTHDDVVKLGDFGIARAVAENVLGVTQPGMVMGSVGYISPEQAQGHELDARSDLYSLGVVIYHMVTGHLPFTGETPVAVALQHVTAPVPQLDPVRLGISPALAGVIETLLRKDPSERYASATDLARALREAREQPATAAVGGGYRNGDGTAAFRSVAAQELPPRKSASPDRAVVAAVLDDENGPPPRPLRLAVVAVVLFGLALVAGYFGVRAMLPRTDVTVADLTGRSAAQAEQSLVAAGLRPVVKLESSDGVPIDRVVHQDPAAGAITAAASLVTLYVSSGPSPVTVPDVKGFTVTDAQRALTNAKLKTKLVQRFDAAAKGTVIDIAPSVGASAPRGSVVTLTVSQGPAPIAVPQLVGLSVDAARDTLAKAGLKLNVDQQTPSDLIPKNTVISQAVSAAGAADPGSTVGVTVSTGPVLIAVPDVTGKSVDDATAALQTAGLQSRIAYIVDATNATEKVETQDPAAQATAPRHSTVTVTIPVPGTVPDVGAMTLDAAKAALVANGYAVGNVADTQDGDPGKVARTEPEANATLRPGETVTIYYHAVAPQ